MHAEVLQQLGRTAEAAEEYERALFFAERTSEKELKFKPEDEAEIRRTIERLREKKAPPSSEGETSGG